MQAVKARARRPHSKTALALLALVGVAFFAGFVALGIWQVQRLAWKLDLIERVAQRMAAAPSAPPPRAQWAALNMADHEYQAVHLQGVWQDTKTVLTLASTAFGPGYWVLTPLQLADGVQIIVNRGFVPQEQRAQWLGKAPSESLSEGMGEALASHSRSASPAPQTQAADAVTAPEAATPPRGKVVTVDGLLRKSEPGGGFLRHNNPAQQRWYSRDIVAIAQAQSLPVSQVAPFFVDAGIPDGRPSTAEIEPSRATQGTWPRTGLTTVRFTNTHLIYAITWFGLALMVVGAGVVVARYETRLHKASRHPARPTAHD